MGAPFCECDDVHDAAAEAVEVISARLARRGLQLAPGSELRWQLADALGSAEVVEVES